MHVLSLLKGQPQQPLPKFGNTALPPLQVAVYPGSFNPIHNTHIQLGKSATEQSDIKADIVEFVPLSRPTHKNVDFMSDEDRHTINKLALKGQSKLQASRADIEGPALSLQDYLDKFPEPRAKVKLVLRRTLNFLNAIQAKYEKLTKRPVELSYIVGIDGLAGYPQAWNEPEYGEFIKKCRLLIAPRPGSEPIEKVVRAIKAIHPYLRYDILRIIPSAISSTTIRKLINEGKPIPESMMPKAAAQFMFENRNKLFPTKTA